MPDATTTVTTPAGLATIIDNAITGFISSKIPAVASLQPEINNAIAALTPLVEKALIVGVLSKLSAKYPTAIADIEKVAAAVGITL